MTPRYLLLVFGDVEHRDAFIAKFPVPPGLARTFATDFVVAYTCEHCGSVLLPNSRGLVIGDLFHRHGANRPLAALDEAAGEAILEESGNKLIRSYWGGYIAAICNPGSIKVMRDPSGALPCYVAHSVGLSAFSSDVGTLCEAGLAFPSVDWDGLERILYSAGLPTSRTAIERVSELLPGTALTFCDGEKITESCWSPWDHVAIDPSRNAGDNAERLKRVVASCVRAWAARFNRPVLTVSGGLDSSIVAACLSAMRDQLLCLTMFTDDAAGDERIFARALCDHFEYELVERRYVVEDIDINAASGSHLPRPVGRTQSLAYEKALVHLAHEANADCFLTGNGGDNVFAYSQSATSILDRFRYEGIGSGVFQTLKDVRTLTGCSAFQAIRDAMKVGRQPSPSYRWRPDTRFLHQDVIAAQSKQALSHPWLAAPPWSLPGQSAHISGLLRVQQNLVPKRSQHAPVVNPLLSQPIVEECLHIPSWQWCTGGVNRAIARIAFANDLPQSIVTRSSKGTPDSFSVQVIESFRIAITERLLDGHLASRGLIDRAALEARLQDERPTLGAEHVRILDLLDTEAWIDHWKGYPS